MQLKDKRAVIVGGSTGIGAGLSEALVERGVIVHLCDIDDDGAAALAAKHPKGAINPHHADLTDPQTLRAAGG